MIKELFKKLDTKAGLLHFVCNDRMVAFCHASIPQAFRTSYKKVAFTLAEVLITLGIIGVVAALTIPNLISSYQKTATESALKKFYSTINNSIRLSSIDNGDPEGWIERGKALDGYEEHYEFVSKYFLPYIKYSKVEECLSINGDHCACIYLQDGSMFQINIDINGADIVFFPKAISNTKEHFDNLYGSPKRTGFWFQFTKNEGTGSQIYHSKNFINTYFHDIQSIDDLKAGRNFSCNKEKLGIYCAKLIEMNNWKIPKDYPW